MHVNTLKYLNLDSTSALKICLLSPIQLLENLDFFVQISVLK